MSGETYTFEVRDDRLIDALESADNRSEMIRSGVRELVNGDKATELEGLKEAHRTAYEWLEGRGLVTVGEAETSIAVATQLDKRLVRVSVLEPLKTMGLIKTQPAMSESYVRAIAPVECSGCGAALPPKRVDEHMRVMHFGGEK